MNIRKLLTILLVLLFAHGIINAIDKDADQKQIKTKKIGILLVNHGSRSESWRNALLDLEKNVRDQILRNKAVTGIRTAFMEYTEPSIASRLKEFDAENYSDVIIVPIFLTVSSHSFDDIPTIAGLKDDPHSAESFKIEKIERYKPKAKVHITPLLDFSDILQKNILQRVKALSKDIRNEGLVLIAYGDQTYEKEWSNLLNRVGGYVKTKLGINEFSFGWCGHVAHYSPDSTTNAINMVLNKKQKALVIPVLVARDEMFQVKIIGDGIAKIKDSKKRVVYTPDAILPDKNVESWVIKIADEYINSISATVK